MTFADQLRAERARLGYSQEKLAEKLGVSFECVSKWERGLSKPFDVTIEGALARLKRVRSKKQV